MSRCVTIPPNAVCRIDRCADTVSLVPVLRPELSLVPVLVLVLVRVLCGVTTAVLLANNFENTFNLYDVCRSGYCCLIDYLLEVSTCSVFVVVAKWGCDTSVLHHFVTPVPLSTTPIRIE